MLVLHNLTPHFHAHRTQEENAIEKTKTTDETVDWLLGLFGMDMGEGHLQNFSVQQESTLDLSIVDVDFQAIELPYVALESPYLSFPIAYNPIFSPKNELLPPDFICLAFRLRGPPMPFC